MLKPDDEAAIAAETAVVRKFFFYHPADRKARARDLLRHIAKHELFKTEDGMADVALEQLWNCMSGLDEGR